MHFPAVDRVVRRISPQLSGARARYLAFAGATLIFALPGYGQRRFGLELTDRFPVVIPRAMGSVVDTLLQPWAGGINSASYSKIDLNTDGVEDLYVHDQSAQRHLTFLATQGSGGWYWRHQPAYESIFPTESSFFKTTLRDYDGDGRPDFFGSASPQYWTLYRNTPTPSGLGLTFQPITYRLTQTDAVQGTRPMATSIYGTASIEDFDNDGDLDILDFTYGLDTFSYFRNPGNIGGAAPIFDESLQWGDLVRCGRANCHVYAFSGTTCRPTQPTHGSNADYAITAADLDDDGDRDLIIGQQYCPDLALFVNDGSSSAPVFNRSGLTAPFPAGPPAAQMLHTPSATYTDLDFDGQKDLLATPWITSLEANVTPYAGDQYDTRQSVWLYRRTGNGINSFAFVQNNFLQNTMIDVGNQSTPTLADLDGDGDLDLLVGNQGDLIFRPYPINGFSDFRGKLAFYRNVGTPQRAIFQFETGDFCGLSNLNVRSILPTLTDLDRNGTPDLVLRFSSDTYGGPPVRLGYILNTAPLGQLAQFPNNIPIEIIRFRTPALSGLATPSFYDYDNDGDRDLLLGQDGGVAVLENRGGAINTAFVLDTTRLGSLPGSVLMSSINVNDFDADGSPDLLVTTSEGDFLAWPSALAPPAAQLTLPGERNLLRNALTTAFGPAVFGSRLIMTSGDLDGDGRPEIISGTAGGGLLLLRMQPNGLTGLSEAASAGQGGVQVFPNPATGSCNVRLSPASATAETLRTVTLRDALGRVIWQAETTGYELQIPLTGVAPGMYAVTALTTAGRSFSQRISVTTTP
jgi:hypothetical protein